MTPIPSRRHGPGSSRCPALLVTAPASGQGKTTVTAALAHWHRSQGRRVRVFKTGPDFLDPMVLERASGAPVQPLDLWMGGEAHCAELLHGAAAQADLILVEGAMGLHDGTPSSADLALHFGLPVLAVIDASSMAQTFGAVAHGLATYRPGLQLAGVLANRVGSAGHAQMVRESLPAGMAWYGALPRGGHYALPSRHLGLVQAGEVDDLAERIAAAARALAEHGPLPMPPAVEFEAPPHAAPDSGLPGALAGVTIAIAQDAAFSFVYAANLALLRQLGAQLRFFSPLANQPVPQGAHALYLPGGYPELHLQALADNAATRESIAAHHAAGRPLVAECGGMLVLLESLRDAAGREAPMLGLLPGQGAMSDRLINLGMHSLSLPEGEVRGHTFHHARIDTPAPAALHTRARRHHGQAEAVFRQKRLFASFMHLYFPSNPAAIAALFKP
ncbi:cobyrinate a,c-diamide synthase [Variovorax sp. J22P271]|uniref:cobyrinate a,c-diamide synthase n=1 Tax=Variovorax davisae TaxID=3053515 RepID=UPI002575AA79|nr:cobyrinate a,c-diamide synthase [Variovorax sp. J22P271]MDM0035103.1 cobyrinate a,c-diamide synthase [Variovorax sp. J22P271]